KSARQRLAEILVVPKVAIDQCLQAPPPLVQVHPAAAARQGVAITGRIDEAFQAGAIDLGGMDAITALFWRVHGDVLAGTSPSCLCDASEQVAAPGNVALILRSRRGPRAGIRADLV